MITKVAAGLLAILLGFSLILSAGAETMNILPFESVQERFVSNPREVSGIGDPFVVPDPEGGYHVFATGAQIGFFHWNSPDLITFERDKALKSSPWVYGDFWAPEVHRWKDRYVMLYTGRWKQNHSLRIGIAFADAPEGPYKDALGQPLFDFGYAAIDGTLTVDGDGAPWLIYSRDCSENIVEGRHESHLYAVRLSDDLMETVGEPVALTAPDTPWETASGDYRWNEGPAVLRHGGKYYLFYSANYYASRDYAVGVAVADSPRGPWVKQQNNPILAWAAGEDGEALVSGPGHNAFFTVGDELFTAYHTHTDPAAPSGDRQLCIDRAGFHDDGTAYINGPTLAPQLRPLAELGLVNYMAAARCADDPKGLLTDGDTCQTKASADYIPEVKSATFTWDAPVTADMLMIWPALGESIEGTATLDGQTAAFCLEPAKPGEAVILPFEAMEVTSMEIALERGHIGEVMLVGAQ